MEAKFEALRVEAATLRERLLQVEEAIEAADRGGPGAERNLPPSFFALHYDPASAVDGEGSYVASEGDEGESGLDNQHGRCRWHGSVGTSLVLQPFACEATAPAPASPREGDRDAEESLTGALSFTVHPELPEGLVLDRRTGVISGSPLSPVQSTTYVVSACTVAHCFLTLAVEPEAVPINPDFAARIEAVRDVADLMVEPSRQFAFGDWMIWMVHRAWLNDPSLAELDFTNMHMPEPHVEKRIAPKLMEALEYNKYIQVLCLANSNLQRTQGLELAEALRKNNVLRVLDIERNCLDSGAVREIAVAIGDNRCTCLEQLMVAHQKQAGKYFGRPTEEAVANMFVRGNETIIKLGMDLDDANWRNLIDRALLRNQALRRGLCPTPSGEGEEGPVEARPIKQLRICGAPGSHLAASDSFWSASTSAASASDGESDDSGQNAVQLRTGGACAASSDAYISVLHSYVAQNMRFPNADQLRSYVTARGVKALNYKDAAPLLRACCGQLLDATVSADVVATDAYGTDTAGTFLGWCEANDQWIFKVRTSDDRMYKYTSDKVPSVVVSEEWTTWLGPKQSDEWC